MARPSKLTEKQWESIGKRLLDGEPARVLAREFGVSDGAIRLRFTAQHKQIKQVANQLVTVTQALKAMPISAQVTTLTLVDRLTNISNHLGGAAELGAATAHRLAGIANGKVAEIDDIDPLNEESMQALKGISVLTRMANESSEIGVNLLKANKDAIDDINKRGNERPIPTLADFYK